MTEQNLNTEPSNSTKPVLCNGLRVGNYLRYKNTNDLAIVELIDKKHFDCRDDYGLFTPNADYEPINLTEEWLAKLGYDLISENHYGVLGHLIWKIEGRFYCDKNGMQLKYVHQLQNLYFALTGSELTVA